MKVRETVLYIGNNTEEKCYLEEAVETSRTGLNFLALDNEPYSVSILKKSQPFWFHSIFFDFNSNAALGLTFLNEFSKMLHLRHVPLILINNANQLADEDNRYKSRVTYTMNAPLNVNELVACIKNVGNCRVQMLKKKETATCIHPKQHALVGM